MPINYYTILNLTETASGEEIRQAYMVAMNKWQRLYKEQPEHLKGRIARVIAYIEEAYQNLSIEDVPPVIDDGTLGPFGDFLLKKPVLTPPMLTADDMVDPGQQQIQGAAHSELSLENPRVPAQANTKDDQENSLVVSEYSSSDGQLANPDWANTMNYAVNPELIEEKERRIPVMAWVLIAVFVAVGAVVYWLFFQSLFTKTAGTPEQIQVATTNNRYIEKPAVNNLSAARTPVSQPVTTAALESPPVGLEDQAPPAKALDLIPLAASIAEQAIVNLF